MVFAKTQNQALIHFKNHTYATETSTTSTTPVLVTSFTIEGPGIFLGAKFEAEGYSSTNGQQNNTELRLSGTSTGTYYLYGLANSKGGGYHIYPDTVYGQQTLFYNTNSYVLRKTAGMTPIIMADETITISVYLRTGIVSSTAYLRLIDVTVYWVDGLVQVT